MHKMVIVVNEDVAMSPGKMAVQVAHAAVSCTLKAKARRPKLLKTWLDGGQKKVVVKAAEEEIFSLEKKAKSLGLTTALIQDAGLTELPPGTLTALAIGPDEEGTLDKVTGHLPLK